MRSDQILQYNVILLKICLSRIAAFFAPVALSVAFSGLLAAAITHLDGKGGKPGWAWIFILEGSFTFLFGTTAFVLLPRSPTKTRFLSQQEQSYIISSLKNRGTISTDEAKDNFSWKQVLRSARSPHVWLVSIASFFNGTILYGMA
ncbi:hypothetical protein ID866_10379 [Astraeus odoratus]|nr:hypothetical protein ID866_10379 [Astraeus odoratus]